MNRSRKFEFGDVQRSVTHCQQPQIFRGVGGDVQGAAPLRTLPFAIGGDTAGLSPLRAVSAAKKLNGRKRSGSAISMSEDIAVSKGGRVDTLKHNASYEVSNEMINYVLN